MSDPKLMKHQQEMIDTCSDLDRAAWVQAMFGVTNDGKLMSGHQRLMDYAEIRVTGDPLCNRPLSKEEEQQVQEHVTKMATDLASVVVAGRRRF